MAKKQGIRAIMGLIADLIGPTAPDERYVVRLTDPGGTTQTIIVSSEIEAERFAKAQPAEVAQIEVQRFQLVPKSKRLSAERALILKD